MNDKHRIIYESEGIHIWSEGDPVPIDSKLEKGCLGKLSYQQNKRQKQLTISYLGISGQKCIGAIYAVRGTSQRPKFQS